MINDVTVTTWTHSSYSDVWPVYYGQYEEMAPFLKHAVFLNEPSDGLPDYCKQVINTEGDPFYKRLIESLNEIEDEIILFSLEDFILYDSVKEDTIKNIISYSRQAEYDFVRLIRSGINEGMTGPSKLVDADLGLYEVPFNCDYVFSLQASLWKKQSLINHFNCYKPANFMESELNGSNSARRFNNLKGMFVWNNEPNCKGDFIADHSDSSTFPFMASALHGGSYGNPSKWVTSLYRDRLVPLFEKYKIDPAIRGEC